MASYGRKTHELNPKLKEKNCILSAVWKSSINQEDIPNQYILIDLNQWHEFEKIVQQVF